MKRTIILLLTILLCLSCAVPAMAVTEESNLVYLNQSKSIVFWVSWEGQKPTVVFLAPDGTGYDPTVSRDDAAVVENGNDLYYVIQNAQAGQWRLRMDKDETTTVEISVHDYEPGIAVEYFQLGTLEGDRLPVSFRVTGADEYQWINYRISAMIDHSGMEKELASGYTYVGNENTLTLWLDSLSSYDGYILKLYVWYDNNGTDIFDFSFSEPFAYTNQNADANAADYSLIIEPETQLLYVQWGEMNWRVDSLLVAVFEDGNPEPAVFDEYSPSQSPVQLSYDPRAKEVAVEVTVKYNGVNAKPVRKTIRLDAGMPLRIPEGNVVNTVQLPMTYQGMKEQNVLVEINDKKTELILNGDGMVNLALRDDWNRLQVSYTEANGVTWRIIRDIYVDRKAPVLTLDRPYDGMTVGEETDSMIISGIALDCGAVEINGETVEVSDSGAFRKEVALNAGTNVITVVAADGAGNESRYTATVVRGQPSATPIPGQDQNTDPGSWYDQVVGPGSWWPMVIVSVLCLAVIGYALIFWRKPKASEKQDPAE